MRTLRARIAAASNRSVMTLLCAQLLPLAGRTEVPAELLTSPLAETFGTPPAYARPRLSPDGSKLLYLTQDPIGITIAEVLDFDSGEAVAVAMGNEEYYDIGVCRWGNATRIFCDFKFAVDADGGDYLTIDPARREYPPPRLLTCPSPSIWDPLTGLNVTPEDREGVLCGQIRFDLYTGAETIIGTDGARIGATRSFFTDGHGFTRLMHDYDLRLGRDVWYVRATEGRDWITVHDANPMRYEDPFRPAGFDADTARLYHLAEHEGRWALFGIDYTDSDVVSELAYAHPVHDLEHVDSIGAYDRVVAAAYLDGRPERFVVDERVADVYRRLSERYPGHNIEVVDESWDQAVYLALVRADRKAGDFYRFDVAQDEFRLIGPEYPHLADTMLAETRTVTFQGTDGGTITGHLTLPDDGAAPGAAVIIPRAGPSALDLADPHYLVQFLAARGYAVLRVNQRGPIDIGGWIPRRSVLGWRQGAADVDAAVSYLVESGIASDRVCALGRDYGAYAAVMSAIEHPGRLACVVGIGAVTDTRAVAGEPFDARYVDALRDGSPPRRASEIEATVLLFHGIYDAIVPRLDNSPQLARALDRADKSVSYIEYPYARHDIERAPYRIDMLTRIASFLAENLGE